MQRSIELENLVREWFTAASRGDDALVRTRFSTDSGVRLIGSDEAEWLDGNTTIVEFLHGEVTGAGGNVTFATSDLSAYSTGAMGWASARLTITLPDGSDVKPRWTAVFEKEEDEIWRFVHIHASIPISNDDAGWTYTDPAS